MGGHLRARWPANRPLRACPGARRPAERTPALQGATTTHADPATRGADPRLPGGCVQAQRPWERSGRRTFHPVRLALCSHDDNPLGRRPCAGPRGAKGCCPPSPGCTRAGAPRPVAATSFLQVTRTHRKPKTSGQSLHPLWRTARQRCLILDKVDLRRAPLQSLLAPGFAVSPAA